MFRVPPTFADFTLLGDDPERDAEWGVPKYADVAKGGALLYDDQAAPAVLQMIFEIADAQSVGSSSAQEAGRILAWVRKQCTKLGIPRRTW